MNNIKPDMDFVREIEDTLDRMEEMEKNSKLAERKKEKEGNK
jgi:hypothetical protein